MARNALNTAFVADPLKFIKDKDHAVGGHDDLLQAMKGTREITMAMTDPMWRMCKRYLEAVDAIGQISFDLKAFKKGGHKMVVIQTVPAGSMSSVWAGLPRPSDRPVTGYWFPYKTLTPQQLEAVKEGKGPSEGMGWVDFPMTAPAHPFVFTGSMQGCAIVVTLSPANPTTHFRAYHYPNVSSYIGKEGDMSFTKWPKSGGDVCAWLDDSQYGASADDVDAFNFLHFSGDQWRIYTQMQRRLTLRNVNDRTDRGVTIFQVLKTRVSEPIPTVPMSTFALLEQQTAWRDTIGKRKK